MIIHASGEAQASDKHATCGAKDLFLSNVVGRLIMLSKHNTAAHLFAVSTLANLSLATVAEAQMYGQGPGQGPGQGGGGMMGESWGWGMGGGMGGFGGIGVIVLALVVLGIAVVAFRRRTP